MWCYWNEWMVNDVIIPDFKLSYVINFVLLYYKIATNKIFKNNIVGINVLSIKHRKCFVKCFWCMGGYS